MISSLDNPAIKYLKKLSDTAVFRKKEKRFLAEGKTLVQEALRDIPQRIEKIFLAEPGGGNFWAEKVIGECEQKKIPFELVGGRAFQKIAATETPQGILALIKAEPLEWPGVQNNNFFLVLEALQDPGNLGTLVRTAEAAGVEQVIVSQNSVDPYNPKVVRASMGSIFRLPIVEEVDLTRPLKEIKKAGGLVLATSSKKGCLYDKISFKFPLALVLGQEAAGISEGTLSLADERVMIPLAGRVESLNVAQAGAILLFEIKKQFQKWTSKKN